MTYSRPGIDTVDAYKNPAKGMDVVLTGLKPRSDVGKPGKVIDARNPAQIGKNAILKTQAIDNFVSFLTDDVAPKAVDELKAQGDAAAMNAVTSIPGMADGSFYRQSSAAQQSIIKDYNLNGYALDQLKAYGASSAVGQYGQQIADALVASPILQSNAPQAERDAEKQRIFSENRALLQGIEPGYLAPYAIKLAELEGSLIGKTENMAREARNTELKNTAITASSSFWTETGAELIGYDDVDVEQRATQFADGPVVRLRQSLQKGLSTKTAEEWYAETEQGMFNSLNEAIANGEAEQAQTILAAWEIATSTPLLLENGYNVWDYGNKGGVDGKTTSEIIVTYKKEIDKLYEERQGEIAIEANADDIGAAGMGDQAALNRVETRIRQLWNEGKVDAAKALDAQLTQVDANRRSRFKDDVAALGRIRTLSRDPETSTEELAEAIQGEINAGLISNRTGIQEMSRRQSPSQLEQDRDAAIQYQEEKTVGGFDKDGNFVQGENQNVNDAIDAARTATPEIEEYLTGTFFGDLDVAVRGQFKEGEPIPSGEELRDIIEAESIKLVKKKTASLKADAAKTSKGKLERATSIRQPLYDAIEQGVSADKIWGEEILNYARSSRTRPEEVWKARYAQSLVGLPNPDSPGKEPFTLQTAQKEARAELDRIRKRLKGQQEKSNNQNAGNRFAPTPVPTATEVSYDTALPGFEEEIASAAKNPDQEGDQGVLAVGGARVLNALGRVLPGGGSPAAAATASSELEKAQTLQAVQNSNGWKSLNRMFARRERVSATSPPLPQLPRTALTDTVPIAITSDRHPFAVHIGIAEGTRTINGGYTAAYKGHRDPGDGHFNRGTFSGGRNMRNATPQQVDRHWMRELSARSARIAPVMARAGLRPGTVGYNRFMFNYLDLSVQAPRAADTFAAKISTVKAGNWSIEVMAKARADSFFSPVTGRLEASGFNNNYSKLLGDQRSRAGVWDYKRRI